MKAASLIVAVVLCFPALLTPQQIFTPMRFPAPEGHPGAGMAMVTERDAALIQVRLWEFGYEASLRDICEGSNDLTKKFNAEKTKTEEKLPISDCSNSSLSAHVEVDPGSDSETILLHAYYQERSDMPPRYMEALASLQCDRIKAFFAPQMPKWLKLERRDNAGTIVTLK